jgi:hypothetical protein
MALQRGACAPARDDPVWLLLIEKRLVCLDVGREPTALGLTPLGWRYPKSA